MEGDRYRSRPQLVMSRVVLDMASFNLLSKTFVHEGGQDFRLVIIICMAMFWAFRGASAVIKLTAEMPDLKDEKDNRQIAGVVIRWLAALTSFIQSNGLRRSRGQRKHTKAFPLDLRFPIVTSGGNPKEAIKDHATLITQGLKSQSFEMSDHGAVAISAESSRCLILKESYESQEFGREAQKSTEEARRSRGFPSFIARESMSAIGEFGAGPSFNNSALTASRA